MVAQPESEEVLVCFCHGVLAAEIRQAILNGAKTVTEIQAKTRASTGCGGCFSEVERLLAEALLNATTD